MSAIHFMNNPFPDNHNGFDYTPQSELDLHRQYEESLVSADRAKSENEFKSMIASIFK